MNAKECDTDGLLFPLVHNWALIHIYIKLKRYIIPVGLDER